MTSQTSTETESIPAGKDLYRKKWEWDAVYLGNPLRRLLPRQLPHARLREGRQGRGAKSSPARFQTIEEGVPDFNPMGCQKGASWSQSLYGPDRVHYPLKRAGERGEGKWNRVTWDQALTRDRRLDDRCHRGPTASQPIVHEGTPGDGDRHPHGPLLLAPSAATGSTSTARSTTSRSASTRPSGKFSPVSSADDWFQSEVVLIWHMNPIYTRIPFYHFIAEARYNGAEVINISPDVNPSHTHADIPGAHQRRAPTRPSGWRWCR